MALLPADRARFDEPLSAHSPIGVGGAAEAFVIVEGMEELRGAIAWAMEHAVDYRFWGGGSRTLARDGGVRGLTIALGSAFREIRVERTSGEEHFVQVGAATTVARFIDWSVEKEMAGAEILLGCRGTIGGALIAGAGTAGRSASDLVQEITVVDREGRELSMKRAALRIEDGRLKLPRTMVIVRALFKLVRGSPEEIRAQIAARREVSPVDEACLCDVFRNPGKVPAAMLIEDAGLKGVRVGGARVSLADANRIVGEGRATARDAIVLMNLIRERVKEQTGVALELRVEVIGDA